MVLKRRFLAIDCSEQQCSVALQVQDCYWHRQEHEGRRHSEFLLPAVDSVLQEAGMTVQQLEGLVFTRGPGAFTGLRIGLSAIQGLSFAAQLPLYPVSTLLMLAYIGYQASGCPNQLAVMDARMEQVYLAAYHFTDQAYSVLIAEQVVNPNQLTLKDVDIWRQVTGTSAAIGSGFLPYHSLLTEQLGSDIAHTQIEENKALALLACVQALPTATQKMPAGSAIEPVYLRDQIVQVV